MVSEAILKRLTEVGIKPSSKNSRSHFGWINETDTFRTVGPCHAELRMFSLQPCYWTLYDTSNVSNEVAEAFYNFIVSEETSPWSHLIDYSIEYNGVPVYSWQFAREYPYVPWFNLDAHPTDMFGFMVALREQFEYPDNIKTWYKLITEYGMDKHLAYSFVHSLNERGPELGTYPMGHSYLPQPGNIQTIVALATTIKKKRRNFSSMRTITESRNYSKYYGDAENSWKVFSGKDIQWNPYNGDMFNDFAKCKEVISYRDHARWDPIDIVSKNIKFSTAANYLIEQAKELKYDE